MDFEEWLGLTLKCYGFEEFEFVQNGANGVVYKCRDKYSERKLVVKVIPMQRPEESEESVNLRRHEIEHEAKMLCNCGFRGFSVYAFHGYNSNGVWFEDVPISVTRSGTFCCVEYVEDSVFCRCTRCKQAKEDHIPGKYPIAILVQDYKGVELVELDLRCLGDAFVMAEYLFRIVCAIYEQLRRLWDGGYVHRDLKLENIVFDNEPTDEDSVFKKEDCIITLIDFGASRSIDYETRRHQPPIASLSASPSHFKVPEEAEFLEGKSVFQDGRHHDFVVVDLFCFARVLRELCRRIGFEPWEMDIPMDPMGPMGPMGFDPRICWRMRRPFEKLSYMVSIAEARMPSAHRRLLLEQITNCHISCPHFGAFVDSSHKAGQA